MLDSLLESQLPYLQVLGVGVLYLPQYQHHIADNFDLGGAEVSHLHGLTFRAAASGPESDVTSPSPQPHLETLWHVGAPS